MSLIFKTSLSFQMDHTLTAGSPPILAVLLLLFLAVDAYTPADHILLNCGSSSAVTSPDGRTWQPDAASTFAGNLSPTVASQTPNQDPSVSLQPYYSSARLFPSNFSYSFPVSAASNLLRLYFYPSPYSDRDPAASSFSVTANNYILLRNFSAVLALYSVYPSGVAFFKEYVVRTSSGRIELDFVPDRNSYAFINAIEIVSVPDDLYTHPGDYTYVGVDTLFYFSNSTALETVYRLNVGGSDVSADRDTGMYRTWQQDEHYSFNPGWIAKETNLTIRYAARTTPPYTAPEAVYKTSRVMGPDGRVNVNYNLSWFFPVDSGFEYLVRLHFCETQPEITAENERLFVIYINNQTANPQADVIDMAGGNGIPVIQDYVVFVPLIGSRKRQDLWLALHPFLADGLTIPKYYDAILNGVEVFKINSPTGSLAGPNPDPPPPEIQIPVPGRKSNGSKRSHVAGIIGIGVGVGIGILGVTVLALFCYFNRKAPYSERGSMWDPFSTSLTKSTKSRGSSLPSDLCRHFSIAEIRSATDGFDPALIIGAGGFGNVYMGRIDGGSTPVAIKRLNSESRQGAHEFVTEIELLSRLRHLNLVSLIGYCVDYNEMILVYEYVSRGTLRDHLYGTGNPPLTWNQRLKICIGAAGGLHYLHTGAKHMIIHRDVKTTNILLDDKYKAKVSDFGLSRVGPTDLSKAHVSTVVKGSFGYLDPEYARCEQLTEKSDVYSFGVVLCEVICARPPLIRTADARKVSLAEWARTCHRNGSFGDIIDGNLKGEIAPECLKKYSEVAVRCLSSSGIERPTMGEVVGELEFVLQLQCAAEEQIRVVNEIDGGGEVGFGGKWSDESYVTESRSGSEASSGQSFSVKSCDSHALLGSKGVFSEIINPTAR